MDDQRVLAVSLFPTDDIERAQGIYRRSLKRVIDVFLGSLLLIILSPFIVVIGLAIFFDGGRPILFRHQRVGKGGKYFYCYKFRTMVRDGDRVLGDHVASNPSARAEWTATRKLKHDPRVTRLGAFLRKSSLDEVPQLLNVVNGEMSLVGPRPIVRDEIRVYGEKIALYAQVRPGLTGPWQVRGRSDVSYATRIAMDCDYVLNASIWRDCKILLETIPAVLKSRGAY